MQFKEGYTPHQLNKFQWITFSAYMMQEMKPEYKNKTIFECKKEYVEMLRKEGLTDKYKYIQKLVEELKLNG